MRTFSHRHEAGKRLADEYARRCEVRDEDLLILAIPRGGVVIGYEMVRRLKGELDVIIPRKIGAPYQPELAVGAVTENGTLLVNEEMVSQGTATREYIEAEAQRQLQEVQRRGQLYRQGRQRASMAGRTVIVVDDGIATGFTMQAALKSVREEGPKHLLVAVPVAPSQSLEPLREWADDVICLHTPSLFYAVGQWYEDFAQVEDEDVLRLLNEVECGRKAP